MWAKTPYGGSDVGHGKTIVIDAEHEMILGDESGGGYLGVTQSELDEETAEEAGLRKAEGVLILSVFDDTPADDAGIEAGDVIVEFGGKKVESMAEFVEMVRDREPGDKVKMRARRDGRRKSFRVTLGEREQSLTLKGLPSNLFMKKFSGGDKPDCAPFGHGKRLEKIFMCPPENMGLAKMLHGMPGRARLGVDVRDLDGDLAEYFKGADAGALVLGVHEGSAAEKAGLKDGDVIVQLGDAKVGCVSELREAVSEVAGEGETELVLYRKGKRKNLSVEIEEAELHIAVERFHDVLDSGEAGVHKIIRRIEDEDWEEKLEQLEERLQELEQRLEKKFGKNKG